MVIVGFLRRVVQAARHGFLVTRRAIHGRLYRFLENSFARVHAKVGKLIGANVRIFSRHHPGQVIANEGRRASLVLRVNVAIVVLSHVAVSVGSVSDGLVGVRCGDL